MVGLPEHSCGHYRTAVKDRSKGGTSIPQPVQTMTYGPRGSFSKRHGPMRLGIPQGRLHRRFSLSLYSGCRQLDVHQRSLRHLRRLGASRVIWLGSFAVGLSHALGNFPQYPPAKHANCSEDWWVRSGQSLVEGRDPGPFERKPKAGCQTRPVQTSPKLGPPISPKAPRDAKRK